MGQSEIDAVRALLSLKPRPVGWAERRWRLDEVGAAWPVAEDVKLEAGRARRRAGRMVDRSRQRCLPSPGVLSWRRLLLRLDPQPSAHGDGGGPRGRNAKSGATLASKDAVDPLIHKGYLLV